MNAREREALEKPGFVKKRRRNQSPGGEEKKKKGALYIEPEGEIDV